MRTGQGAPAPWDLLLTLPNSPLGRQRPQARGRAHDLSSRPHPISQVQTPDPSVSPAPNSTLSCQGSSPQRPQCRVAHTGEAWTESTGETDSQAEGALV